MAARQTVNLLGDPRAGVQPCLTLVSDAHVGVLERFEE
jgi:hypothetical protein